MKFLIVDDDRICAAMFKLVLSKYGACDIITNGPSAIKAYEESLENNSPYNLMILDIIMPDMHGGDALKLIRQIEEKRGIPEIDKLRVIVTTAFDDWYNRNVIINNLDFQYENYFLKSSDFDGLVEKIQDLGYILEE